MSEALFWGQGQGKERVSQDCVLGELAGQAVRLPVGTGLLEMWQSCGPRRPGLPWILTWLVAGEEAVLSP